MPRRPGSLRRTILLPAADHCTRARLVSAVLLIPCALLPSPQPWLLAMGVALLTDVIDGPIARYTGTASDRGATRDSTADIVLILIGFPTLWLRFDVVRLLATWQLAAVEIAYAVPVLAGFAKFGRLTSYHTRAARAAGTVVVGGVIVLLLAESTWLLNLALLILGYASAEELWLTAALPAWRSNVSSWRAVRAGRRTTPLT